MKVYQINSDRGIDALEQIERDEPDPGPHEVLVRVHASSINYRDLSTIENPASRGFLYPRVPNSDGAGDVVAIGSAVSRVKVGDRVCGTFFQGWIDGEVTSDAMQHALGGSVDGMLCEHKVLNEDGLVLTPAHLSDIEASTLPCAALTAWNSLVEKGGVTAGSTVLVLGTGGVSMIALQFCRMLGARVIVTSSSDEKLARVREMGAWETINYRSDPHWDRMVLDMTDGRGVDHTVEVGGAGTLAQSINATRLAGSIGLIGVLTGGEIDPMPILRKSLRLQGIYVGNRRMFENMNRAIALHQWEPVIDTTYEFDNARQAYHDMRAAKHFGKLVITL